MKIKKEKQTSEKGGAEKVKARVFQYNSPGHFDKDYFCYLNVLDEAIDKENIFNIGVIAPYGSGKSSFIKTYFDNHPKKKAKTCNVSLATIANSKVDKTTISNVEKSILEQILFKRGHSWLSKTKLDRIHGRLFWTACFAFLLISTISLVFLSIMEYTKTLPFSNGNNFYWYFGSAIFAGLIASFLGFVGLKINKVSFRNVEIEFDRNSRVSILNLFIDEIINYCSESKVKYFVFEDIDRFDDPQLFYKLREINKLINENELIKNKIAFIYCVGESIFKTTDDRAKFFDFIISLVPVLNPNNAREFITKAIQSNGCDDLTVSESAIMDVCIYIKEIRILNNIVNDYIIYHDCLHIHKIDNDKLFAMMVYKNLYPYDFTKLQSNSGELYDVFNKYKEKAIENASSSIIGSIDDYERKIKDLLFDDAEVEFAKLKQRISGIIIENGTTTNNLQQIKNGESINNRTVQSYDDDFTYIYIDYNYNAGYYGSGTNYRYLSVDSLKKYLDNKTPSELENDIFGKSKADYQRTLDDLYVKNNQCKRMSVVELISNDFFGDGLNKLKENKFLYFAVINGYIDESYFKFSGRQDTELDNEYIDKVLVNASVDPEEKIQNPNLVISRLGINRFSTKSVLNYYIADTLLSSKKENKDKRAAFVSYLSANRGETIQFMVGYLANGQYKKELLDELRKSNCASLVADVVKCCGAKSNETTNFIKTLISISKDDGSIIKDFDGNGSVAYVMENSDHPIEEFFQLFEATNDFIEFLKNNNATNLKHIDDISIINNQSIFSIFNQIIENAMFEINEYNIRLIATCYFKTNQINATTFLKTQNTRLSKYFREDMNALLKCLTNSESKFSDDGDVIKEIITSEELSLDIKNNYLLHLDNKVDYVDGLPAEIFGTLLANNLLLPKFSSISKLLKNKSIDAKMIVDFIRSNISSFDDSISKEDFINLVNHDETSTEMVKLLCRYFNDKIDINDIASDSKRSIVIEKQLIVLNSSSLKYCKGMYGSIVSLFNIDNGLIDYLSENLSNENDYIKLIENINLTSRAKSLIISKYYSKFASQLNDVLLREINDIVLLNQNNKYDYRLLASLLKLSDDETATNSLLEICKNTLSDKEILNIVKENNTNLFNILNSGQETITVKLSIINDPYFKLLESKKIIKSFNKRVRQCNVNVAAFKTILSSN